MGPGRKPKFLFFSLEDPLYVISDANHKSTIYLLHTCDNVIHDEVVKLFIKYLKDRFDCVVISQSELAETTRQSGNVLDQLEDADAIIIVQSEAAFRLYNAYKTECICDFSRSFGTLNESFVLYLSKVLNEQRTHFFNKTFTVQFACTLNEFVITHSRIKSYKLVENIKIFEQNLHRVLNQRPRKSFDRQTLKDLNNQTEACKTFKFAHPDWFNEAYCRVSKSSISSYDSGVDIRKDLIHNISFPNECHSSMSQLRQNRLDRQRRRSLSLDTISGQCYGSASMQRDQSFSFSDIEKRFISPEFGDEQDDTPTVVLTEQMRDINERYTYIVNRETELIGESFEKLGTSV